MSLTEDQKNLIVDAGAFNYDAKRIANITELPESEIEAELKNPNSEISLLYEKGLFRADYVIDQKLFELAQRGDIKALEKLELRKKLRNAKGKQKAH